MADILEYTYEFIEEDSKQQLKSILALLIATDMFPQDLIFDIIDTDIKIQIEHGDDVSTVYIRPDIDILVIQTSNEILSGTVDSFGGILLIDCDSNLKHIQDNFMAAASISGFMIYNGASIETIGDNFLHRCLNLENVDMYSLQTVTRIGKNFMSKCRKLKRLNLTNLHKLSEIDDNFMNECNALESVVLPRVDKMGALPFLYSNKITE